MEKNGDERKGSPALVFDAPACLWLMELLWPQYIFLRIHDQVGDLVHIAQESTSFTGVAPATLKVYTECFRLIALSGAVESSSVTCFAR